MRPWPNPITAANAGKRVRFRFAVHVPWPGLAEYGAVSLTVKISAIIFVTNCLIISLCGAALEKNAHRENASTPMRGKFSSWIEVTNGSVCSWLPCVVRSAPITNVTTAVITIHGHYGFAKDYCERVWSIARSLGKTDATYVMAPQFLYEDQLKDHRLERSSNVLFWGFSGWQCGEQSVGTPGHPRSTSVGSFEVLDKVMRQFVDRTRFPRLQRVVVVGHSASAWLAQGYAASTPLHDELARTGIQVRYVIAAPSIYMYLSPERRIAGMSNRFEVPAQATRSAAPDYDRFPLGLGSLTVRYVKSVGTTTMRERFRQREIIYLVGSLDVEHRGLTTTPAAMLQGGNRLERAMIYRNHLEKVFGPAILENHKFVVVPGFDHGGEPGFFGTAGAQAIFGDH